jgi:hypothetical protein
MKKNGPKFQKLAEILKIWPISKNAHNLANLENIGVCFCANTFFFCSRIEKL